VPPTRVLICEDAPGFSVLARAWLNEDQGLDVVGTAQTAAEAVALAGELRPDVVLLDRTLPDASDALDVVAQLRGASPGVAIVLMSSMPADQLAAEAKRVGAQAWVPKAARAEDLREAVHRAFRGT
jgi:DNA-binding NarL/FixJ family response regulator